MTLLESVVAFVVLALVGIACLDLSRGAVQLQRSSSEWTDAVRIGEAALAAAVVGEWPEAGGGSLASAPVVSRRPWRNDRAVEVVEVSVPLSDGGAYRVQRLVRHRADRSRDVGLVR